MGWPNSLITFPVMTAGACALAAGTASQRLNSDAATTRARWNVVLVVISLPRGDKGGLQPFTYGRFACSTTSCDRTLRQPFQPSTAIGERRVRSAGPTKPTSRHSLGGANSARLAKVLFAEQLVVLTREG